MVWNIDNFAYTEFLNVLKITKQMIKFRNMKNPPHWIFYRKLLDIEKSADDQQCQYLLSIHHKTISLKRLY